MIENKKLKSIDILFENCDSESVDVNNLNLLNINSITSNFLLLPDKQQSIGYQAEYLQLILKPAANIQRKDFGNIGTDYSLFDRIVRFNDITAVMLNYEDGSIAEVFLPWGGDNFKNTYMSTKELPNGLFEIIIEEANEL